MIGGRYIMEQRFVGSSASNGVVEGAIQRVEQHVRVLKSALVGRWGVKLETRHPAIPWISEHAAVLLNRLEVGHDGKTTHERNKGNKGKLLGMEFGEATLWKRRPVGGAQGKFVGGRAVLGHPGPVWRTDRFRQGGGVENQDGAEEADRRPLTRGRPRDDPEDVADRCG